MTADRSSWWGARVVALVLVVLAASLIWRTSDHYRQVDQRPIWIEPGEYKGPAGAVLDPAQVDAIAERAQRLSF